ALEPIAPGAPLDEATAIHVETAEIPGPGTGVPEPARAEPAAAALASTSDLPAVSEPVAPTPVPPTNPKLVVLRGQRMDIVYPLYPGKNYLGRTDDKPVDIDLDDQEASDRIWTSRQHAVINYENGDLTIEDLNSLNGTFVNRSRVHPGQLKELRENDVIQVGTVHLKVVLG
ncbi:MAG TPA: FHA domain-containing protein, partial [Gemmataceae bacterium]|nr:FHA domain-containing protein [Gemmataceae bacterium]